MQTRFPICSLINKLLQHKHFLFLIFKLFTFRVSFITKFFVSFRLLFLVLFCPFVTSFLHLAQYFVLRCTPIKGFLQFEY